MNDTATPTGAEGARVIGVIPARWGSTRFPGKSLAAVAGRPLLHWVIANARRATCLDELVVATDDERIAECAAAAGVAVAMTAADHPSGTDRVAEAVVDLPGDVIVNIQGDEPLLDPELITRLAAVFADDAQWDMSTAVTPIRDTAMLANPGVVKAVWDSEGRALYFSRLPIPGVRDAHDTPDGLRHWRHLGVYGYRRAFLERLVATPPCVLEQAEKLEQLRALYIGARMAVVQTGEEGIGVDTPEDVPYVERLIAQRAAE